MEDKSSNITLKGRNALRPDEIDLKYLIEDCDLVKAIEEHDYDVHVNQLDFTGMNLSYSEKDLRGLFERTDVRSVDKIDELKLIDLSAVGIGLKEKRQGGTERDRYVCLDRFVGCVNDGVDNEREKIPNEQMHGRRNIRLTERNTSVLNAATESGWGR